MEGEIAAVGPRSGGPVLPGRSRSFLIRPAATPKADEGTAVGGYIVGAWFRACRFRRMPFGGSRGSIAAMSVLSRAIESPFAPVGWQPEAMARLDERHLVVWSEDAPARSRFAASFQQFLGSQPETDVCPFYGSFMTDLDSFCHQLERVMPVGRLDRRVDGPHGVTSALRSRESITGRSIGRSRYIIWNDADALLLADKSLFGRLIDAIAGVSAEWEYASDDLLLIQRCVLVGGPALAEYAAEPFGQMRVWAQDAGCKRGGRPFWQVVTGLERPPVDVDRVENLMF